MANQKNVLLILDHRKWFWKKYNAQNQTESLDVALLCELLNKQGFLVNAVSYMDFDFDKDYRNHFIVYTSSEDFNQGTKDYIEDILLYLMEQGAILIPAFKYFRAHNNKVMMELLRKQFKNQQLKSIASDMYPAHKHPIEFPVVIKSSTGAGSQGVYLAKTQTEYERFKNRVSRLNDRMAFLVFQSRNLVRKLNRQGPVNYSNQKYITQNFIHNLDGDYKVLIFNDHYYILHRKNRKNDFRASGSGNFIEINPSELDGLLDFARLSVNEIDSPFISMDIGFDGTRYHLIEFQCVSFGLKTLTLAQNFYMQDHQNNWQKQSSANSPEEEFSRAISTYISKVIAPEVSP